MTTMLFATAHGFGEGVEKLGVIAVALLGAVVVLGRSPRVSERSRALAMLAVLVVTPALLLADIWHTSQLTHLRHHPAEAGAAVVLGVIVVLALAVLIHREPRAFPLLAIFALPFRLPIATGGSTSNLLIPLYLVVGAGTLAYLTPRLRYRSEHPERAGPILLEWLLAAAVVLYALQAAYSADFSKALENMVFFYVPFALLFALLREVKWTRELLLQCLAVAVALAVVFAGIGFVEYDRKQLFLNPKVVAADQYGNYFRVNSLFFDPNIYGRFLALVMIGVMTGVLWSVRRREVLLGGAVLLWLLAGLVTSFSQSSIAALLLGLAVLAAYRWDVRGTIYVTVALAAIALVVVAVAPPSLHLGLTGKGGSASNATSGRTKLIEGGLRLFADRPLQGFGPGSFAQEYRAHEHVTSSSATSASHTIPVTVAAEQGIVGLALYVALLVSGFVMLFRGAGRSPPRIALAACFAALVLHTFTYADFLEDPETWVLLGIGVALACAPGSGEPLRGGQSRVEPAALTS
ncbi:MAG TPA: O-antigen ligase family protein [Solirubrobacteraceae bacterium]|nr:O-antigen ligase family protein [Solirubrobacteraceae bacterium]